MTDPWTHERICQWQEATFGPLKSVFVSAARANEEMAELLRDLSKDPFDKHAAEEAADVIIVLGALVEALDIKAARPVNNGLAASLFSSSELGAMANADLGRFMETLFRPHEVPQTHWIVCVYLYLAALCEKLGTDLQAEIDKKMEINIARTWTLDGDGCGKHVRAKDT